MGKEHGTKLKSRRVRRQDRPDAQSHASATADDDGRRTTEDSDGGDGDDSGGGCTAEQLCATRRCPLDAQAAAAAAAATSASAADDDDDTTTTDPNWGGSTTTTDSNKWQSAVNVLHASNAMKGGVADAAAAAVNKAEMIKNKAKMIKKAEYYDDASSILCSPAPEVMKGQQQLATLRRKSATPASLSPSSRNLRRVSLPNILGATRDSITTASTPLGERPTRAYLNGERLFSLVRSPSPPAPQSASQPLSPSETRQPVPLPLRGERAAGAGRDARYGSVAQWRRTRRSSAGPAKSAGGVVP